MMASLGERLANARQERGPCLGGNCEGETVTVLGVTDQDAVVAADFDAVPAVGV